ncbi:MAG: hypothetical protein Q9167_000444 [Letrouitia subvulpina]
MPLLFTKLCDLLSRLEENCVDNRCAVSGWLDKHNKDTITQWVRSNHISISSHPDKIDLVAILSAICPADRTDRVYGLQPKSLSHRLKRCLRLGNGRWQRLDEWQYAGHGDLGDCVERTLKEAEHPEALGQAAVTVEEIDVALEKIASRNRFSGPEVRAAGKENNDLNVDKILEGILHRLQSREAKWLTRMILKDYGQLDFKSYVLLNIVDPRLAELLKVRDKFAEAVEVLKQQSSLQNVSKTDSDRGLQAEEAALPMPKVGVKVGRPSFLKGRSVKQTFKLAGGRTMSVERKHDGEYCQVHIDLSKGTKCIQIFSKSGKDSTNDRSRLHATIKECLRIGRPDCGFSSKCILEGEMVVYSDKEKKELDFYLDSQAHEHEHLMIIFYDVMCIDEEPVFNRPQTVRRRRLCNLVTTISGRAKLVWQEYVDFSKLGAASQFTALLADAFAKRWEGLVLKPANQPYFGARSEAQGLGANAWIKVKKDYIPGLGDTADFAVVGAGYNVAEARMLGDSKLKWTHFHLGCLRNKKQMLSRDAKPCFKVIGTVNTNLDIAKYVNQHGQFQAKSMDCIDSIDDPFGIYMGANVPTMAVVFPKPFVFEVMGAGFDKDSNRDYFTLRWPRVLKIHSDRDWQDSVSFDELQRMAKEARVVPGNIKEKVAEWIEKLEQVDRGKRRMNVPWDLSDDELQIDNERPTPTRFGPRRSTNPPISLPMVRMDTNEMTDKEKRLESGEVVECPVSQDPHVNNWTDSPLPTPPRSSPLLEGSGSELRTLSSVDSSSKLNKPAKKRAAMYELIDNPKDIKRLKVSSRAQIKEQTAAGEGSNIDFARGRKIMSLETIGKSTNTADLQSAANIRARSNSINTSPPRPRNVPPIKSVRKPPCSLQCSLSTSPSPQRCVLVRKLPRGYIDPLQPRNQNRRVLKPLENHSSYDRQTTTDDDDNNNSSSICMASTQQSLLSELQLPPLSSWPPPTPPPRPVQIPDFSSARVLLSPCVAGHLYLTENLLTGAGIPFEVLGPDSFTALPSHSPFPAVATPPCSRGAGAKAGAQGEGASGSAGENQEGDIILLVELRRHDETLGLLKYLVSRVPRDGKGKGVSVWDWRVVEDVVRRKQEDVGKLRTRFAVRLGWDGQMEGCGSGEGVGGAGESKGKEGGEVMVVWADGTRTVISEHRVEESRTEWGGLLG